MRQVIADAAAEVDRPIVYAIAVIVAGFLPIYVLTGPSGRLFEPMADTTIFALDRLAARHAHGDPGALRRASCGAASRSDATRRSSGCCDRYERGLDWCLARPRLVDRRVRARSFVARDRRVRRASARSSCRSSTKARSGCARRCRTRSRSRNRRRSSRRSAPILRSFPEVTVVTSEHGRPDDGTNPTGFFNAEFYVGLKPYGEWNGALSHRRPQLIAAIDKKLSAFPGDHLQLHAAGRGRGRRGGDGPQELARREAVRHRPRTCSRSAASAIKQRARRRARHHARHARAGARPAEPHDRRRSRQDRALRPQRRAT